MIHLIRHGETEWSRTRRHTGRTDVPLTEDGRRQAAKLADLLAEVHPVCVLTSPLSRAADTCALAGFASTARTDERLLEWDYGQAEGLTTAEIREEMPDWSVWTHPLAGGESLPQLAARIDSLLHDVRAVDGDVLLCAHAHLLRVLAARWCELDALAGRHLVLDPASWSGLGYERETPVVAWWNRLTRPG